VTLSGVFFFLQIRDAALQLMQFAKASGTCVVITGHVTKSGDVAGPRTLEHIVDTSLVMEADDAMTHRIVRCTKNRFGSSAEVRINRCGSFVDCFPTAVSSGRSVRNDDSRASRRG
jgi:predicted ATP-dependent serine protease